MTIDKAVEILDNYQADMCLTPATDLRDAVKLGIEALKRINEIRESPLGYTEFRLPGETKE